MAIGEEDAGKGQLSGPAAPPAPSFPPASVPPGKGVTGEVLHTKVSATSPSSEVSCRT